MVAIVQLEKSEMQLNSTRNCMRIMFVSLYACSTEDDSMSFPMSNLD